MHVARVKNKSRTQARGRSYDCETWTATLKETRRGFQNTRKKRTVLWKTVEIRHNGKLQKALRTAKSLLASGLLEWLGRVPHKAGDRCVGGKECPPPRVDLVTDGKRYDATRRSSTEFGAEEDGRIVWWHR